jgi:hypothetical protein
MKIIFVNHILAAKQLNNKPKEIIFSLNPTCSFILGKRKKNYYDYSDFYNHKFEWKKYFFYNSAVENIISKLDKIFFKYKSNYKKKNWHIFNDHSFVIKIWYDTLLFHAKILYFILKKFNPDTLEFPEHTNIEINNNFLIDDNTCILENLAKQNLNLKINYYSMNKKNIIQHPPFLFGQPKFYNVSFFHNKLKNIFSFFKFLFFLKVIKTPYIGIGCDEVKHIRRYSNRIVNFDYIDLPKINKIDKNFIEEILKEFVSCSSFNFKNINFLMFFIKLIEFIFSKTDHYLRKFNSLNKLIDKNNIESFVFQTMSPLYYPVFIFRKIANSKKIPFITWTHGGYFTFSNPGYDVVDYKFCRNHIGYGKYLIELLNEKKTNIRRINKKKFNINYVGSLRFDHLHNDHISRLGKKKTITFFIGCQMNMNSFYNGYNRKNVCTSIWREQFSILKILYKFSNRYNIVIKDYPHGSNMLWKSIIELEFKSKFTYISKGRDLNAVLSESDLNIFPWISTTFFESLYYNADIFIYDEDLFYKPFKNKFNKEVMWSTNLNNFKIKLFNYLKKGNFYKMKKNLVKSYFINHNLTSQKKTEKFLKFLII